MRNHDNNNHVIANLLKASAAISISIFLAACGDDSNKTSGGSVEDQEVIAITDKTVSGVSQKGPFVNGSSVTVQELDGTTLAQTGLGFEGKIKNDLGEFSIKVKNLQSQYALLKANGFYRNEVSGEKSKSQVTLYALTDLSNRDEVNVNLLTHLEYERSLYLATDDSVTVAAAKKQAEKEVLASFGITGDFANSEDLNIFGTDDGAAALLAISVLMQGDLSEADFTERLNDYATDIETDGKWDDFKTATDIADWSAAKSLGKSLSYMRTKIISWGLSADIPDFEKYVDNFWWQNYGLGTCNERREGEVKKNENSQSRNFKSYFICENKVWRIASDTEYDTYQQKCDEDGKIIFGNVNKDFAYDCDTKTWRHATDIETALGGCIEKRFNEVAETKNIHYICQKREWHKATDIEKDTYGWKTGNDADIKYGDIVKTNCYVFEDSAWRSGYATDCSLDLRGCTALRQDTVGKGNDKVWHICDAKSWRDATTYEKDTFGWKDSTDGAIKKGNVTDTVYVFDKMAWRVTSNVEAKLGGCASTIADSVGKVGSTYYICKSNKWVEASAIEYDTYRWAAGKDGDSKWGSVNAKNCYVFEDKLWRSGNASDFSLGLRGCTVLRQDTVGLGTDNIWYKCVSKNWRTASNIEKDTATWGAGKFDGEVRAGQVNRTIYYIYETSKMAWRNATTIEKDTYDYTNNKDWGDGVDGEIKKGSITDTIYVFDAAAWRSADDVEKVLGGCVSAIQDSVGKVGDAYYICNPRKWNVATALQYDTYKSVCSKDGKMFKGNVNTTTKYVCDNSVFRAANEIEIEADSACTSYNRNKYYILPKYDGKNNYSYYKCTAEGWSFTTEKLNQGTMIDERDGHKYKTIGIKSQMWMAENLNYADSANYLSMLGKSWCQDVWYNKDSCVKYGRYYSWSATIDSIYWEKQGMTCGFAEDAEELQCSLPEKVQGICPDSWHVPSSSEWKTLYSVMGNNYKAMQAKGFPEWKNATDEYGFSALPAGYYSFGFEYNSVGNRTYFWSTSQGVSDASSWYLNEKEAYLVGVGKGLRGSVRCIKD